MTSWEVTMTKLARYAQAYTLRQEGRTFRDIGHVFGVSDTRARNMYLKACDLLAKAKKEDKK